MAVEGPLEDGWSLHCDQLITRRKRYHIVCDADRVPIYRSRLLCECIDYCRAEGLASIQVYLPETEPVLLVL